MAKTWFKALIILLIIILVLNIYFYAIGEYDERVFWAVILIGAVFAYFGLPRLQIE